MTIVFFLDKLKVKSVLGKDIILDNHQYRVVNIDKLT